MLVAQKGIHHNGFFYPEGTPLPEDHFTNEEYKNLKKWAEVITMPDGSVVNNPVVKEVEGKAPKLYRTKLSAKVLTEEEIQELTK
jgi:hypothetical protein